jgi:hypothetical protein
MNFEIKYEPGYVYYAPRVYNRHKKIEKEIDGEVYSRNETYREIVIKKRRIAEVALNWIFGEIPTITYYHDEISIINPSDLQFNSHTKALKFATKWYNEHPNEEYFG